MINILKCLDYSSCTNWMAENKFILSICEYLEEIQFKKMLESPFISFMLDESTNCSFEKHLFMYERNRLRGLRRTYVIVCEF